MSTDGRFEQKSIEERAKAFLAGGRVWVGVPDDALLPRAASGAVRPYLVLGFQTAYAVGAPGDRSIMGEEEQPHVMPFRFECWAPNGDAAHALAGAVRTTFIGWEPSPGASEIRTSGSGASFNNRSAAAAPTRFVETVPLEVTINLGSNDGSVPSPGNMEPGGAPLEGVSDLIAAALAMHVADPTPHPAYDNIPDLVVIFENHLT